jgi:radical SAM protein with 4Fe4S-binding SPASM domain
MQFFPRKKTIFSKKVIYRKYICKNKTRMIIYNLNTHTRAILEDLSATLFEKLNISSDEDIYQFMSKHALSEEDVSDFIKDLVQEKILEDKDIDLSNLSERNDKNSKEENLFFNDFHQELYENGYLFSLHIDVTKKCNLQCIHCYHVFNDYDYDYDYDYGYGYGCVDDLSLDNIKKRIDEAYVLGAFLVIISGGEPFLREDIFEILNYITNKGMVINVFTNATLLDNEETIGKLNFCNINKVSISIYSTEKDIHESITKFPSYDSTCASISRLLKHNIDVELKCMLMKKNFTSYNKLIEYANVLNCNLLFDISLTPKLNGDIAPMKLALEYEDILKLSTDNSTRFYVDTVEKLKSNDSPCNAGKYSIYIDHRGDIYPCVSFRMKLGDVNATLNDIWFNNESLNKWRRVKNKDFVGFGTYSYCKYCLEICAGVAQLENGQYTQCQKSDCYRAKAREEAHRVLSFL